MLYRTIALLPCLLSSAPAQRDGGPLIASQVVGTIRPGTRSASGPLSVRELHTKKAGFQGVSRAGATSGPDLSFAAMFPDPSQPDRKANIHIDALSIAQDFIWADAAGKVTPTGSQWVAMAFSVESGTTGGATGVIANEAARPDGAGADVFTFSYGALPPPLVNVTRRAIDSEELDLYAPGFPGDLAALDLQLAAYTLDAGITSALDPNPTVFFSVTHATRLAVPATWWAGSTPSGATILRTQWNGSSWTPPQPAALYSDLYLTASDDVDALAIQCFPGYADVVFSTTALGGVVTSQVMIIRLTGGLGCGTTPPTEVKATDGAPIEGRLGNGNGNVDGVCMYDPSFLQPGSTTDVWAYVTGTPIPTLRVPGAVRSLEASAWRTCPGGNVSISSYVTGWVGGTPGPDTLYYVLGIGLVGSAPVSFHLLGAFPRTGTEPGGGRFGVDVPLPPGWARSGLLYVEHIWLASSLSGDAQAFPVKIRL